MTTCLTPEVGKNDIIKRLSVADPCAIELLEGSMDDLWRLGKSSAPCNRPDIIYYETYRTAIELLMGCDARQFDLMTRVSSGNGTGEDHSRFDANSQSQSSNSGYRESNSCAHSRYADLSRMISTRRSRTDAANCNHTRNFSRSADVGSGRNKSMSQGKRNSFNTSKNENLSASVGSMSASATSSSCNKSWAGEEGKGKTEAKNTNVGLSAFGFSGGAGETASTNTNNAYSGHVAANASKGSSSESRSGKSARSYCARGASHSKTLSEACSYFNNDFGSEGQSKGHSESAEDSQGHRHEYANAAGAGESRAVAEARQTATAQMTNSSHSDFDSKRRRESWTQAKADSLWRSQRFKNLKALHENANQSLNYLRSEAAKSRQAAGLQKLEALIRDGSCDLLQWKREAGQLICQSIAPHAALVRNFNACTAKRI
jgi:hypothetical protein